MSVYGEQEESRIKRLKRNVREGSFTYALSDDEPRIPREVFYNLILERHRAYANIGNHKKFLRALKKVDSFKSLSSILQEGGRLSHLFGETPPSLKNKSRGEVTGFDLMQMKEFQKPIVFLYEPERLEGETFCQRPYVGRILHVDANREIVKVAINDGTLKSPTDYDIKYFSFNRIRGLGLTSFEAPKHYRFVRLEINRDFETEIVTVNYRSTMREPETMTEDLRQEKPKPVIEKKSKPIKRSIDSLGAQSLFNSEEISFIESLMNKPVAIRWGGKLYSCALREYAYNSETNEVVIYGDRLITDSIPLNELKIVERGSSVSE